jgi:hypothetical protein
LPSTSFAPVMMIAGADWIDVEMPDYPRDAKAE